MNPLECAEFLREGSREEGQNDVVVHRVGASRGQDRVNLLGGQGLRGPTVAARRQIRKLNHVASHLIACRCSPKRSVEACVRTPKRLCAERLGELGEPRLDFPGGQLA